MQTEDNACISVPLNMSFASTMYTLKKYFIHTNQHQLSYGMPKPSLKIIRVGFGSSSTEGNSIYVIGGFPQCSLHLQAGCKEQNKWQSQLTSKTTSLLHSVSYRWSMLQLELILLVYCISPHNPVSSACYVQKVTFITFHFKLFIGQDLFPRKINVSIPNICLFAGCILNTVPDYIVLMGELLRLDGPHMLLRQNYESFLVPRIFMARTDESLQDIQCHVENLKLQRQN